MNSTLRFGVAISVAMAGAIPLATASTSPSASAASSSSAGAASASSPPIEVSADLLDVATHEQRATLSGKVTLTKGSEWSLKCPRLEVRYDSSGPKIRWAKGEGGIVAEVKGVRGEAPEFELDLGKQKLSLRGGVRLTRGLGWITADNADIDLATARVTMTNVKASLPTEGGIKTP